MYVQVQLLGHVHKSLVNMNFENRVNVAKVTSRF